MGGGGGQGLHYPYNLASEEESQVAPSQGSLERSQIRSSYITPTIQGSSAWGGIQSGYITTVCPGEWNQKRLQNLDRLKIPGAGWNGKWLPTLAISRVPRAGCNQNGLLNPHHLEASTDGEESIVAT